MCLSLLFVGATTALNVTDCFHANVTAYMQVDNRKVTVTTWPLPLAQQVTGCQSLQRQTKMTLKLKVGSYTFTDVDVPRWPTERPHSQEFMCETDATKFKDCLANLTNSTVAQLNITSGSSSSSLLLSITTTTAYYTLSNNTDCWKDTNVSADYMKKELCFLATPIACDLVGTDTNKDSAVTNNYQASILIHANTVPDIYLNVTLSSHGTSATLPEFRTPYYHSLTTKFCYSCEGVKYPSNNWLTDNTTYDECLDLFGVLKTETAWSATLLLSTQIPEVIKITRNAPFGAAKEVIAPLTTSRAGQRTAIRTNERYMKCYNAVTIQVYFGTVLVLMDCSSTAICANVADYKKIVLRSVVTGTGSTHISPIAAEFSLDSKEFNFKQTRQFFLCSTVACLTSLEQLYLSNASLSGEFEIKYFLTQATPETIAPFAASVQRACFYRSIILVAADSMTLHQKDDQGEECPLTSGKHQAVIDVYLHSGSGPTRILQERLFLRLSGSINYEENSDVKLTCDMYQTGVYATVNVPKPDLEYYIKGSCADKLKSILEAYNNKTGVYASIKLTPTSTLASGQQPPPPPTQSSTSHEEYQYLFEREDYSESMFISLGVSGFALICGVIMLAITYNKGHIMEA